jgi:hypothetical protein
MIENKQYCNFDALQEIRKKEANKYYPIELLDDEQIVKLKLLNKKLSTLEIQIAQEIKSHIQYAKARITDQNSLINNFNCDLTIEFYLDKDSKYYNEENNNIIMAISCTYYNEIWDWGIDDKQCHNTLTSINNRFKDHIHCYSFHCLYDHTSLNWNEILYIKDISYNINLSQSSCEI